MVAHSRRWRFDYTGAGSVRQRTVAAIQRNADGRRKSVAYPSSPGYSSGGGPDVAQTACPTCLSLTARLRTLRPRLGRMDMLTVEENIHLTQVGAGTPAGELHRRYWQPIAATST